MKGSSINHSQWAKSTAITTVFCLVIALTTQSIWQGQLIVNIIISLGFGYSALMSSFLIALWLPSASKLTESAISMTVAVIAGTINAQYWLNGHFGDNLSDLKSVMFLGAIFCAMCFYYFYSREQKLVADNALEVAKRKQADQDKVVVLSQLKQLQSQIEPHFLFNTLATINVLIETDSEKAKLMLEKLTELLRVTLKNSRSEQSTVEQELALIDAYLNIQKIRLGERLAFSIEVDGVSDTQVLPPFLIQPLVENALTHGIEPKAAGGHVSIRIMSDKDTRLTIEVADNGAGINASSATAGHGVGLSNIRQRIETLFEGKANMSIKEQSSGGVISTLVLPKMSSVE